jgi:glycine dehydrogenase subunit 1
MDYSPLTENDIQIMLKEIGVKSIDDLFKDIPKSILNPLMNLERGLSELETIQRIQSIARKNTVFNGYFCGAGSYNHFIPPVINELLHRGEFYTAYTPYQAEKSQGFLQAIFEYQTAICNLTGMDVTNASVYDGATALMESIIMAKNITNKRKMLIIQPLNPEYLKVLKTYSFTNDFDVEFADIKNFTSKLDDSIAAVVIQNPNFFGQLVNLEKFVGEVKAKSSQVILINLIIEPTSLGLLKRPGTIGVDIVCGEGQALGIPMSFGGPGLGIIATTNKHFRKLPGRIVGRTKELNGDREGYLLTLQAREQHIKREKALSNICSNEALCMLSILLYLASMGYSGLRALAELNVKNTHFLIDEIKKIPAYHIVDETIPLYNEFLIEFPNGFYSDLVNQCVKHNVCPPIEINEEIRELILQGTNIKLKKDHDYALVCNTEMNTLNSIQDFIMALKSVNSEVGGD